MPEATVSRGAEGATGIELGEEISVGARSTATSRVVVLKFGSSVIPTEPDLARVVGELGRWRNEGWGVIAVVSAFGGATDSLLAHAASYGEGSNVHALASYVATGEAQAVALLGLALGRAGIKAEVLDAASIGLRTEGPPLDSRTRSVDARALERALERSPVVLLPGFVGRDEVGRTTLLGRGGSDLTALFVAHALGARCRLMKDVDGLYDRDPACARGTARRYARVRFDDVLSLDEGIVQHKAVRFARERGVQFEVGAMGSRDVTLVGTPTSAWS